MGRVTIMNLTNDYKYDLTLDEQVEVKDIEIVPRKMVEMIIERCECTINCACYTEDNMRVLEARDIKEYAESLLKQFEEEE